MSNLVSWALVTLSEVKEALDISTSEHDAKLNGYINRASGMIETYCKRRFASTAYTSEEYAGTGTNRLQLQNFPISTLTSVERLSNSDFSNQSWESLNARDFTIINEGGSNHGSIYFVTGVFNSALVPGVDNYRVSYTAGYSATDMPYDLREACIEIVSYLFNSRRKDPLLKGETLQKYSYTRDSIGGMGGIIKALGLEAILDSYRTPTI